MKSLQESLFDQDLVKKSIKINFETLRDMLFDFLDKRLSELEKNGLSVWKGRQSIYIRKHSQDKNTENYFLFELDFGVTNFYNEDQTLVPGFNIPILKMVHPPTSAWRLSSSEVNGTMRKIYKKIPELKQYVFGYGSVIKATEESISMIFKLYEGMIKWFGSKKFDNELNKYIQKYESKQEIPGFMMDLLMKQLIEKA